jgi:CHAT domain-containing protein
VLSDSLVGEALPFSIERVQGSLSPDEAIVGWLDTELLPGDVRSWAFVIRSGGPVKWERLASRTTAGNERFSAFRNSIAGVGSSAFVTSSSAFALDDAQSLWQDRFGPLTGHLEGATRLVLVPSEIMAGVPIDALIDDEGRPVGDRYALRLAPSCAVHTWVAEHSHADNAPAVARGLLVGDPAFTPEHLAKWSHPDASAKPMDVAVLRSAVRGSADAAHILPRLPWSRSEVKTAADVIPEATVLLGADATASRLREIAASGELEKYNVLHLATHALVDAVRPGRSALVLSQVSAAGAPIADDGVVTADEVGREWKLDADLVVLSACETALGRNVYGEGTVGFAYPLFLAGARSVLASLWPVNDEACALLMQRFYRNWLIDSMTKAEALRSAKRWLRKLRDDNGRQPYSHPYYWAAFTLVGN